MKTLLMALALAALNPSCAYKDVKVKRARARVGEWKQHPSFNRHSGVAAAKRAARKSKNKG